VELQNGDFPHRREELSDTAAITLKYSVNCVNPAASLFGAEGRHGIIPVVVDTSEKLR
jgi:hypothetical protein